MRYTRWLVMGTSTLVGSVACTVPQTTGRAATVFYASGADLQSINPLFTVHPLAKAVQKHVLFVTLASYDSTLEPVPYLASWEWDADRTGLTFAVRRDVWWHDGTPTTAFDVAWTLEMARHPDVAYPRARDLSPIRAVSVADSFTVVLRFWRPQATFPDVLTDLAILPAHRLAATPPARMRESPFNSSPVGNGPFAFVEHRPNQRWVFRRTERFPADLGRPYIEQLVIAIVDESATKLAALTSGELDFAGINPAHADFVNEDERLRVIDYPVLFVYALVWNMRQAPFDDVRVRRALTMALDRQSIVNAALYGFGMVADGPVPPAHPWFTPVAPIPHDLQAARTLLQEAGWREGANGIRERNGQRFQFALTTVGSGDNALEQMIQAQLRRVGVSVTIRQLELTTFLARAQGAARAFDALVIGIPGDLSLGYVAALFEGDTSGPLAYAGYASTEFDAAVAGARAAESRETMRAWWQDAQHILARDLPTTWLYHARGLQGVNRRVLAAPPDLRGEFADVTQWRIDETRP
jgi:peptide/nickel transport system substrate-binding protein